MCFGHEEMREELEREDKLPGHCQGWHFELEKVEIQGGGGFPTPVPTFLLINKLEYFTLPNIMKGSVELTCG